MQIMCKLFNIYSELTLSSQLYVWKKRERVSEKEARGRGVSTQQPTSSFQSQTYHFTVTTCSLNPPLRIFLVCYRHTVTGTHDPGFPLPITVTKVHSSRFLIHLNSLTKRIFSSFFPPTRHTKTMNDLSFSLSVVILNSVSFFFKRDTQTMRQFASL